MNQGVAVIFRGEIWWATMPKPLGSEPGFRRPVLIIQSNRFNRSRLATVIGIVLTTNLTLAELPGNVLVPASETGLENDSVVNITQIVTLDRRMLETRIGKLSDDLLGKVEDGLRLIQDL
jgi:mRNA interferase MazF